MHEKFGRRIPFVLRLVRINGLTQQLESGVCCQMKVTAFSRHPRADVALEYHSIAGVEEHLCGATRRLRISVLLVALVGKPEVANSLSHAVQLPRTPSDFVVNRRAEIPRDFRLQLVQLPGRLSSFVQKLAVRQCAFTDDLRENFL